MKTSWVKIVLLAVAVGFIGANAVAADPSRWEKDMAAFAEQDRKNPPAQGGVLFLGSSSIRMWSTLAKDFPGIQVANRGFGGSTIPDCTYYFDQLVMPSKPRLIVFFVGTNDINSGAEPEKVAADFRAFCEKLNEKLPETRLIFISLAIVPSRWAQRAKVALTNTYAAAYCAANPERLTFVDMNSAMLTSLGETRPELYRTDRLHMNADGYAIWTKVLKPLVK